MNKSADTSRPKVYLAGPITGLTYGECTDWRDSVKEDLSEFGINGFSPMRNKEFLRGTGEIDDEQAAAHDQVMCSDRGIMRRDTFDVRTSDALLVNLAGAEIVSIGTVIEIAMAHDRQIPIVVVMEDEGNIHEHSMLRECFCFRVPTMEKAIATLKTLFIPG